MAFSAGGADIPVASSQQLDALHREQRRHFFRERLTFYSTTTPQAFFTLDQQNAYRPDFRAVGNSYEQDLKEIHIDLFRGGFQLANGVQFFQDTPPPVKPSTWLKDILIKKAREGNFFDERYSDDQLANVFLLADQKHNPASLVITEVSNKMAMLGYVGGERNPLPQEVNAFHQVIDDVKSQRGMAQTNRVNIIQPKIDKHGCGVTLIYTTQYFKVATPQGEMDSSVLPLFQTKSKINVRPPLMTLVCRADSPLQLPGAHAFTNLIKLEITIYHKDLIPLLAELNNFLRDPHKAPVMIAGSQAGSFLAQEMHGALINQLSYGPQSRHAFGRFSELNCYTLGARIEILDSSTLGKIYNDFSEGIQLENTATWQNAQNALRAACGNQLYVDGDAILKRVLDETIRTVFSECSPEQIANIYLLAINNRNNPIYIIPQFIMQICADLGVLFDNPRVCLDPIYQRLDMRFKKKKERHKFSKPTIIIADRDSEGVGFTHIYSIEYTQMRYQEKVENDPVKYQEKVENAPAGKSFFRIYLEVYTPLRPHAAYQPKRLMLSSPGLPGDTFKWLSDKIDTAGQLVRMHQELLAKPLLAKPSRKAPPKQVARTPSPPIVFSPITTPTASPARPKIPAGFDSDDEN